MRNLRILVLTLALLWLGGQALALPGSIKGKIYDQASHEPVMGVTVTVVNTSFGAVSDSNGNFTVPDIPPGYYNLRFSRMGYKIILKNRVLVRSAQATPLEVDLGVKPLSMSGMVVRSSFFRKDQGRHYLFPADGLRGDRGPARGIFRRPAGGAGPALGGLGGRPEQRDHCAGRERRGKPVSWWTISRSPTPTIFPSRGLPAGRWASSIPISSARWTFLPGPFRPNTATRSPR